VICLLSFTFFSFISIYILYLSIFSLRDSIVEILIFRCLGVYQRKD